MRQIAFWMGAIFLAASVYAAGLAATYKGTWSGSASDGALTVIFEPSGDGKPNVQLVFNYQGQDVKSSPKTVEVNGTKVKLVSVSEIEGAEYETTFVGEVDDKTLQGKYATTSVSDGSQVDAGTWKANRVP